MRSAAVAERPIPTMDRSALVPGPPTADRFWEMPNAFEADDDRARAADRFARRAQSIASLLDRRLKHTISAHDLSEKRLWAAHREMAEQHRRTAAPTPGDYWEKTAYPRAQRFLAEMVDVVAAEEEELTRAFQQFAFSVAEQTRRGAPAIDDNPLEQRRPTGGADIDLDTAIAVARSGVDEFVAAAAVGNRINEVGAWWQGKLRRKAIVVSMARLLVAPVGHYQIEVAAAEMRLLARPPWSLDDRLLSAFELAHSDLREHLSARRRDLHRRFEAMLEEAAGARRQATDRPRRRPQPDASSTTDAIELL